MTQGCCIPAQGQAFFPGIWATSFTAQPKAPAVTAICGVLRRRLRLGGKRSAGL